MKRRRLHILFVTETLRMPTNLFCQSIIYYSPYYNTYEHCDDRESVTDKPHESVIHMNLLVTMEQG